MLDVSQINMNGRQASVRWKTTSCLPSINKKIEGQAPSFFIAQNYVLSLYICFLIIILTNYYHENRYTNVRSAVTAKMRLYQALTHIWKAVLSSLSWVHKLVASSFLLKFWFDCLWISAHFVLSKLSCGRQPSRLDGYAIPLIPLDT